MRGAMPNEESVIRYCSKIRHYAVNKQIIHRKVSANKQIFHRKGLKAATVSNHKLINQLVDPGSYGMLCNYGTERFII